VILTEPWWNPFVEEQAIDRAHRIGQTRPVKVIRLAIADTVEESILDLQERKRELSAVTLSGDHALQQRLGEAAQLHERDLLAIFGMLGPEVTVSDSDETA